MHTLVKFSRIKNSFSYDNYKKLAFEYAENNGTSGHEQLPERVAATKLNAQRIKRIDKQSQLNNKISDILKALNKRWTWIILMETWCGDGAQNIPVIAKMAGLASNIDLQIILRDENPEIMNSYLTNGSRSIPKLICLNQDTMQEIGTWGPRPMKIQKMVQEFKLQHPESSHDELVKNIHLWYAQDKGCSIQEEFTDLLLQWSQA